jgi:nucleotide-binding universal stress UspA family protein
MMSASRIVVGIDDTPTARAALRWAAQQARIIGATVRAVHVIDWPIGIEAYGSVELDEDGHLPEEKVSANRRGIRRVFEEASPEPGWQLQFAEGETGPVLIAEAADADLLVIGTRTNPDWTTGDVAGPVAHHCLSRTTCPVVTVPLDRNPESQ